MELLSRKRETEDTENNTDDWELPGIVLQLHGGGYYGRMHNTYRDMAGLYNEISKGYDVLSVDYRVAPEHPYPAALEDALAAYQWIMERGYPLEKLIVAGDSAGGGLALALCLYLLSDTKTVARHAMDAGVTVKEHIYPGMFHVFQMGLLLYPEAKEAWIEVGRFIRYLRKKEK